MKEINCFIKTIYENLFITATSASQQRDLIFSKYCSCLKNCLLYCYLEIKDSLSSLVKRHLDRVVVSPISIKTYSSYFYLNKKILV